jgi:putative oxidoreductase
VEDHSVSVFDPASPRWNGIFLSVLRVVAAIIYVQHGTQKLFAMPAAGGPAPVTAFTFLSLNGTAGVIEFCGGMLLLIGLFTRPVAFILSGEMAVAYFKVHAPRAFLPIINRGELPVMLCFVFLYFVFAGGGSWSVDGAIAARRFTGLRNARRPKPS